MANTISNNRPPISPDLLEILRDPQAIQHGAQYGSDPGKLTLVHNCWLVSEDTGYKYPIRDGIPVMLIEEGARWKDTPVDALPVPPPSADASPVERSAEFSLPPQESARPPYTVLMALGAFVAVIVILITLGRRRSASLDEQPYDLTAAP